MLKNKISKLFLLASLSALLLTGCGKTGVVVDAPPKEDPTPNKVETVAFRNIANASFTIGLNQEPMNLDYVPESKNIIEWYMDPYCPACIKLETMMEKHRHVLLKDEEMVIRYHILSFLSPKTMDDYSNRAAAFILGSAEFAPNVAMKYLDHIFSEDFHPGKGESTSDEVFKSAFYSVGGTEAQWAMIEQNYTQIEKQVKEATSQAFNSMELINKSPQSKLAVPFILLGNSEFAIDFEGVEDAESHFLKEFDAYKEKLKTPPEEPTAKIELEGLKEKYLPVESLNLTIVPKEKYLYFDVILIKVVEEVPTNDGVTEVKELVDVIQERGGTSIKYDFKDKLDKVPPGIYEIIINPYTLDDEFISNENAPYRFELVQY